MPESTVVQSILGTLGQIGGIGGRRAQDGLTAAQAEEVAIKNKASRRILQDDDDKRLFADNFARKYITQKADRSGFEVTPENAARWAEEDSAGLAAYMNPEAQNFFSTKGAKGNEPVALAGIKKLPGEITQGPNPLDAQAGPISLLGPQAKQTSTQAPNRYVIELRTQDGRTVPATQNASAAADDALITLTPEDLAAKLTSRTNRIHAAGGAGSDVVDNIMFAELGQMSDDYMRSRLAQQGPGEITDEPAASRNLYDILDKTSGEDLNEFARDAGLDPDKLREEAQAAWTKRNQEARDTALKNINTEGAGRFEDTKALLQRHIDVANNAIAEFDRRPKPPSGRTGLKATGSVSAAYQKFEKERNGLVKERDAAQKAFDSLKPPKPQEQLASGAAMPKFEWTEDNLRESLRGKLDQPTPEQTSALTKYAKDQGVATAQDITKLPERDAQALMWAIAANARGATPDQKIGIFDKLNNIYRTGDAAKSPIDAKVAVVGAQVDQANAATNARQVDASIANNDADNRVAWANLGLKREEMDQKLDNDLWAKGKDVDAASNKVRENVTEIYKGTIGNGNKIQAASPEAMVAWKNLRSDMMTLPKGSPQQIAASNSYLEGFFQMAAAQSVTPGAANPLWDWTKVIANTFMREDGMVNMSPLMETARIEYKNGKPDRVSFTDHGGTGKETKLVVGADEFKRFTGASDFTTFVDAVHSLQAKNLLQSQNLPVTPENVSKTITAMRKSIDMK